MDRPQWLFSMTNSTPSRHTAARFMASWTSPSLVAPSPTSTAATRSSPRSRAASARPSATGAMAPRWLIMPTTWWSSDPKWKVRSRPPVNPPSRPSSWRNSTPRSMPRPVNTARLRWTGRIQSSGRSAATSPTEMASWPMPENHLESCPRRSSASILSSMARGSSSAR